MLFPAKYKVLAEAIRECRPEGEQFAHVWIENYAGDHESELVVLLLPPERTGLWPSAKLLTEKIYVFVVMRLGLWGSLEIRAVPTLDLMRKQRQELDCFRGDALHAIYQSGNALGKKYAKEMGDGNEYPRGLKKEIEKDSKWLAEHAGC